MVIKKNLTKVFLFLLISVLIFGIGMTFNAQALTKVTVTLNKPATTITLLKVGATDTLVAAITPASGVVVTWESSNTNVVTLTVPAKIAVIGAGGESKAIITAKAAGTATVTVTARAADGTMATATCKYAVT